MNGKDRNTSFEVLRIIAMLFIVCSHCCKHSGFDQNSMVFSFNKVLLQIGILGNLGVAIFVMISGYFLSQSEFRLLRIVKLVLQVVFYSITIYLLMVLFKMVPFSKIDLLKSCFPILFEEYWFATTYVVFFMLIPFANKLLNNLTRRQHLIFLGLMVFMWSIVPTITSQQLEANSLSRFLMFYSLGAFVRRHPSAMMREKGRIAITITSAVLLFASTLILDILGESNASLNHGAYFYSIYSILIIGLAYGLLLIFANKRVEPNRIVNLVGRSTFGVYLIHDNQYMREFIWIKLVNLQPHENSPYLLFYLLVSVITVYIVCIIIDRLRIILLERPIIKALNPSLDSLSLKIKLLFDSEEDCC